MARSRSAFAAGVRLILFGLPGVASLLLVLPEIPEVPRVALLVNPFVLLVVTAFLGAALAPRCGFRSHLAGHGEPRGRLDMRALALAGLAGIGLGIALTLLDRATAPLWRGDAPIPALAEGWTIAALVNGVAYGGVVEEIIMRWGLMCLFVWLAWRVTRRGGARPGTWSMLFGVVLAALFFALGHLPILFAQAQPDTALMVRTLGLNFVSGVVFGLYFWRVDLEASMASHAGFHVGVALVAAALAATA